MKSAAVLIAIATTSLFTSCVVEPPEAKKMTFVAAMQSLSDGMQTLRDGAPKDGQRHLGLVPTEMTANFELTTTANNELGVNLAAVPTGPFSSASFSGKNTSEINRKNTVQVVFKNIYVDKDGKPRPAGETNLPKNVVIPGATISGATIED